MLNSRFLGYDECTRGYAMNRERKYTVTLSPLGEVYTQEYRGVTKRWLRHPKLGDGKQLFPWVPTDAPITSTAVDAFFAEWPRGFESGKIAWRQRELRENAYGSWRVA